MFDYLRGPGRVKGHHSILRDAVNTDLLPKPAPPLTPDEQLERIARQALRRSNDLADQGSVGTTSHRVP